MKRPFLKLRHAIEEADYTHAEFAPKIGLKHTAFSQRLNCHVEWTLGEMYAALDLLGLPHSALPEYFPPNGRTEVT